MTLTITGKLRAVADLLDAAGPDLPPPFTVDLYYGKPQVTWNFYGDDYQRTLVQQVIRLLGGSWDKRYSSENFWATRETEIAELRIVCEREQVCTRKVVGTETVTRLVPADDAPMVEVTEEREIIEWDCSPLLSERVSIEKSA